MNLSRLFLTGISTLAFGGMAQAADLIVDQAPAAVVSSAYDWSGFYVGTFVGGTGGTDDWTGDFTAPLPNPDVSGSLDVNGWQLGVAAGANVQFDTFVLGVEGDIAWSNISGEGTAIDPLSGSPSIPSGKLDWLGTVRGRAGVAVDNVLLYGTAGFAAGAGTATITNVMGGGDNRTVDANYTGWAAGVGAEYALSDNMSIKAEYLYTSLTADDVDFGAVGPGSLVVDSTVNAHTVKVGLNFGF